MKNCLSTSIALGVAFVTAHGSSNSHTAILARNMNIPAIIGVGDEFLKAVKNGSIAIVDGYTGEIFVEPDEAVKARLEKKRIEDEEKKRFLQELKGKENITIDGTKVDIYANIGSVDNIVKGLLQKQMNNLLEQQFHFMSKNRKTGSEKPMKEQRKINK